MSVLASLLDFSATTTNAVSLVNNASDDNNKRYCPIVNAVGDVVWLADPGGFDALYPEPDIASTFAITRGPNFDNSNDNLDTDSIQDMLNNSDGVGAVGNVLHNSSGRHFNLIVACDNLAAGKNISIYLTDQYYNLAATRESKKIRVARFFHQAGGGSTLRRENYHTTVMFPANTYMFKRGPRPIQIMGAYAYYSATVNSPQFGES